MARVVFKPRGSAWITSWLYEELSSSEGSCFVTTLDIGLTREKVCVSEGFLVSERIGRPVLVASLRPSAEDRIVVVEEDGRIIEAVAATEKGFYKLKAVGRDKAPTLEINGIHMHRVTEVDPWTDSLLKVVDAGVRRGDLVLDTCMGLGYTALASILRGASRVLTFVVDENVIRFAELNPWSRMLADERVEIRLEDVVEAVRDLPSDTFDRVIHDPPRLTREYGDLYSREFYAHLYRVLKPGGVLYHYTGLQRARWREDFVSRIGGRLKEAGFDEVRFSDKSLGFVARKL